MVAPAAFTRVVIAATAAAARRGLKYNRFLKVFVT
jgi:hypothetical protein